VENLPFDREFLRKLENMAFLMKKARLGRLSGQHRSPRKGQSVEFADYRSYVPGDDWRQVDWHAYARLERLFVKLFMEEQDLTLYLLLDTSASMGWGAGTKLKTARQLAAALGYMSLVNQEQVSAAAIGPDINGYLPVQRGRGAVTRLWGFIMEQEAAGNTDMNQALRQAGRFIRRPGITVLISDLLSPSGFQDGLNYLQHLGQQVVVLHVLEAGEMNPQLLGNYRLVDCETGLAKEVSITPMLLEAYREQVRQFIEGIRDFCRSREITYQAVGAEDDIEQLLLRSLRSAGVLA